jgi:FMN phosphatase YigB (HAD superfamily)
VVRAAGLEAPLIETQSARSGARDLPEAFIASRATPRTNGLSARRRAVLFDAAGTLIERARRSGRRSERRGEVRPRACPRGGSAMPLRASGALYAPAMVYRPAARRERAGASARRGARSCARPTSRRLGDPAADFEAASKRLFRVLRDRRRLAHRAGAHEALAALRAAGVATGVVSNFDRPPARHPRRRRARAAARRIWLPSDAGAAKPDPMIFTSALARSAWRPSARCSSATTTQRDLAGARAPACGRWTLPRLLRCADLPALLDASFRRSRDDAARPRAPFFRRPLRSRRPQPRAALDTALERRIDYADLFFEYSTQDSVVLEEGIVKTATATSSRASACARRSASARAMRTATR